MIKGIIFDMDGVLLDSMGMWQNIGFYFLKKMGASAKLGEKFGVSEKDKDSLREIFFSMSMEEGAEYIYKNYILALEGMLDAEQKKAMRIPKNPEEVVFMLMEATRDFYFDEVSAKPGAGDVLALLRSKNLPIVLVTSSPRSHAEAALSRLGLLQYFTKVFTTSEIGESKHTPTAYRVASDFMGTNHDETLVFEDSLYALKTAKEDGYVTIGVCDLSGEPDQEGLKAEAKYYIEDLTKFEESFLQ